MPSQKKGPDPGPDPFIAVWRVARFLCILLFAIVGVGCRSDAPEASAVADRKPELFPVIAPVADADPSVRHAVEVRVPTAMEVVRRGDSLKVSFPNVQTTNLMVGYHMVTGIEREDKVYRDGTAQPRGMSLQGGLTLETGTNVLTLGRDGIPGPGQEFTLEHRITLFETDVPAQHMWSPQSGKHYRILWTQTFNENIK
jgi:hypothetical protein